MTTTPKVSFENPVVSHTMEYVVERGCQELPHPTSPPKLEQPTVLVAFEFSGALRTAITARGEIAISVDLRPTEQAGLHYQGDIRDIIHTRMWKAVYFVGPPCHHQLRADKQCLRDKVEDGRAYWAVAMVLWCICYSTCGMLLVEQPDTIAHDYIDVKAIEDAEVFEVDTTQFGDQHSKFMRFTARNLRWEAPQHAVGPRAPRPTHWTYADADERDKARSSWKAFPNMCKAIAAMPSKGTSPLKKVEYTQEVERLAVAWHVGGNPLPKGYNAPDARPPTEAEREYQSVRGHGDGRRVQAVLPRTWSVEADTTQAADTARVAEAGTTQVANAASSGNSAADTHVVPIKILEGQMMVGLEDGQTVPAYERAKGPIVERATSWLRNRLGLRGPMFSYLAGRTKEGQAIVVTVGDDRLTTTPPEAHRRRRAGAAGALLWLALAMIPSAQPARTICELALASTYHLAGHTVSTTAQLLAETATREATGFHPGVDELLAPARTALRDGAEVTPHMLLPAAVRGTETLRQQLVARGGHLAQWADAIRPMQLSEIPSALWDRGLRLHSGVLNLELFAPRLAIYETPWLDRMPPQKKPYAPECDAFKPSSVRDLLLPSTVLQVEDWLSRQKLDLHCLEDLGPQCNRSSRPYPRAFGQSEFHQCAKGVIWDCRRRGSCQVLDYQAGTTNKLNSEYLRRRLAGYPDQRLASNLLEGIRLEADMELQLVLNPQLASIGEGYDSVQKTVRELSEQGYYDFFEHIPFAPMIMIGQGSRIKKLGGKYRRTSDFSGPHKEVVDAEGKRATPVNAASKSYQVPEWIARSHDHALRRWSEGRYAHVPEQGRTQPDFTPHYKFPKERKPLLTDVLRDGTLLLHAALELNEPIFVWVWDAAHYFNQLAYAPEELWKSTLTVGARVGDVSASGRPFEAGEVVFVSESRLGFGSFASSNIAQRLSNAIVTWTLEDFDQRQERALATGDNAGWKRWREQRRALEGACRVQRPKRRGIATPDCNQTRLATIHMYTDDPLFIAVGVERAIDLMEAWNDVVTETRLIMAGDEKRQLGAEAEWVGVMLFAALGLLVIPRNKLVRAREAIRRTIDGTMSFGEYRVLLGLLEHLRFVACMEADSVNPLYRPHGKRGESSGGPSTVVRPDALMMVKLHAWLSVIEQCAGAQFTIVFVKGARDTMRAASQLFAASSDAAGDGRGTPGMGGYCHGFYWRMPFSTAVYQLLHITAWETIATVVTIFFANRIASAKATLSIRGDAVLAPRAIAQQSSSSIDVQEALNQLLNKEEYRDDISHRVVVQHLSGEGNIASDLVSRGLWEEFSQMCEVLRVRPTYTPLDAREQRIVREVATAAARRHRLESALPALEDAIDEAAKSKLGAPTNARGWSDAYSGEEMTTDDERHLTELEQGLGVTRRDNSKGDGPPFQPPWKLTQLPPCEPSTPQAAVVRRPHRTHMPASNQPYTTPLQRGRNLRADETAAVDSLVERLANDRTPGRIDAPKAELERMARAVAEAKADGTNIRTSAKSDLAWKEFKIFAELKGFDPNLTTRWTQRFPERESLKLCMFLLFTAQRMRPRSRKSKLPKPMSIYQRYLALRRVFNERDQQLPPSAAVRATLKGLVKRFLDECGIEELRPKRVEPITPDIVEACAKLAQRGTTHIKGRKWNLSDKVCRSVTTWMVVNMSVGSRKGESTQLPGDSSPDDWFTRSSITWRIGGRVVADPSREQLLNLTPSDIARLAPKGAKCDQYGTCHGTEPIVLPYRNSALNAAKWLRDLEIERPCHGDERRRQPLFANASNEPFTASAFSDWIARVLAATIGPTRAELYTPHSWRVWLASSLRMAGANDATIQALGRWLNPESLCPLGIPLSPPRDNNMIIGNIEIETKRNSMLPLHDLVDHALSAVSSLFSPPTADTEGPRAHLPAADRLAKDQDGSRRVARGVVWPRTKTSHPQGGTATPEGPGQGPGTPN